LATKSAKNTKAEYRNNPATEGAEVIAGRAHWAPREHGADTIWIKPKRPIPSFPIFHFPKFHLFAPMPWPPSCPHPASHPWSKMSWYDPNQLTTDFTDTIWIKDKRPDPSFPVFYFPHFIFPTLSLDLFLAS
jgi:hypothetical protein